MIHSSDLGRKNFEPLYEWPELVRKLPPKEQ
jgi:hypothetical protein